jgi:anti-sigma factor RsiW
MINPQGTSHQRFEADLAELAAGVLDRREEAALLNHLASCPRCAAEFDQLASAAKSLLLLVLEIEPPAGFEARFWDRIDSCSSEPGSRRSSCISRR